MKVPRGGAGLIGGQLDGQAGYLAKQQQLLMASNAHNTSVGLHQTNSQRLLETQQPSSGSNALDNAIFYQQNHAQMMAGADGSGQQQNKGRYANGKKKIANNAQQPYAHKNGGIVHHNQMSALSGQDQSSGGAINMISEGALSQLINSHINESDANNKTTQGHSTANDSFENANLAFWTRK